MDCTKTVGFSLFLAFLALVFVSFQAFPSIYPDEMVYLAGEHSQIAQLLAQFLNYHTWLAFNCLCLAGTFAGIARLGAKTRFPAIFFVYACLCFIFWDNLAYATLDALFMLVGVWFIVGSEEDNPLIYGFTAGLMPGIRASGFIFPLTVLLGNPKTRLAFLFIAQLAVGLWVNSQIPDAYFTTRYWDLCVFLAMYKIARLPFQKPWHLSLALASFALATPLVILAAHENPWLQLERCKGGYSTFCDWIRLNGGS